MEDVEWVKVAEFGPGGELEADMMVVRLQNADIPVRRIPPTTVAGLMSVLPVAVVVPKNRADQARAIMEHEPLVEIARFRGRDAEDRTAPLIRGLQQARIDFARFPYTPDPHPLKGYTVRILVDAEDEEDALEIAAGLDIELNSDNRPPESSDG